MLGISHSGSCSVAQNSHESISVTHDFRHAVEALVALEDAEGAGLELEPLDEVVLLAVHDGGHLLVVLLLGLDELRSDLNIKCTNETELCETKTRLHYPRAGGPFWAKTQQ